MSLKGGGKKLEDGGRGTVKAGAKGSDAGHTGLGRGGGQDDRIASVKSDSLLREKIGVGVADIRVGATVPLCTRQSPSQEH